MSLGVGSIGHDFFISYAGADEAWAGWIAWELEEAGYLTFVQAWDFAAGSHFVNTMHIATQRTERTVVILSEAYLRSAFAEAEWQEAWRQDPSGQRRKLLIFRIEDCPRPGLLGQLLTVDLFGVGEQTARERLLSGAQQRRNKPQHPPHFPGMAIEWQKHPVCSYPGNPPKVWNLPLRNTHFVGRDQLLREARQRLQDHHSAVVHTLYGMGGVGKSQLALEYAHRFASDYELIWWIAAEHLTLVADSLVSLAPHLGLPHEVSAGNMVTSVVSELRRRSRWLLIFDNANSAPEIAPYIPGHSGHSLITSRTRGWDEVAESIEVDLFTRHETITLLRQRVPSIDPATAEELAVELGDLPLAAAQAAAYITKSGITPGGYLELLQSHCEVLLAKGTANGYQYSVANTWRISFDRLQRESPAAIDLLQLCAFLGPEPIPLDIFVKHVSLLPEPLRSTAAQKIHFMDVVGIVVSYSLARRPTDDSIQLHRLVQAAIRYGLSLDLHAETGRRAASLVAATNPGRPRYPVNWQRFAALLPHTLAVRTWDGDGSVRMLLIDTIVYLHARGQAADSCALSEEMIERWRRLLRVDHPDFLSASHHMANALRKLGHYERARELGLRTLEMRRDVLGWDHPDTLASARRLANTLADLGRYVEARDLHRETLDRCQRELGLDHPDTLAIATDLAFGLSDLGEYAAARDLHQGVLQRRLQLFGQDDSDTLWSVIGMAWALAGLGNYEQARALDEDAVERRRRVFGPDHPYTLIAVNSLAADLQALRFAEEAKLVHDDNLHRRRRVLGTDHPHTLQSAVNLANVLADLGDYEQARDLLETCVERLQHVLGTDHPLTAQATSDLDDVKADLEAEHIRPMIHGTPERHRF